jgi:RecB family endonuclease NucS
MSSKAIGENRVSSHKPFTILITPNIDEAENLVKEAISHSKTLLAIGRCSVSYQGRAKSKLAPGERILVIKGDGSLLVLFHVHGKENRLEIRAVRQKPPETVIVVFDDIQTCASYVLSDSGEFSLYASEEDMQKAILLRPDLLEEGFRPITYEKKVESGFVDVYGEDKTGKFVVVEIKRKTAGKDAALQLARYLDAIRARTNRKVRGILVAPDIGKDVQRTLVTLGLEYKHLDPRKCAEILTRSETKKLAEFF